MVELVLFIIFGLAALFGAVTMVWARNPVYSAMGLMLTMFSIAVFYVSNGAHFIAAELTPGDEELLIRRQAVDGRRGRLAAPPAGE